MVDSAIGNPSGMAVSGIPMQIYRAGTYHFSSPLEQGNKDSVGGRLVPTGIQKMGEISPLLFP